MNEPKKRTQRYVPPEGGVPYRVGTGVVLFNRDGLVLYGERADTEGAWQWPQGGLDEGEDPAVAARRELAEETGVQNAELLGQLPACTFYDFPDYLPQSTRTQKYRGQMQYWFAFRFLGDNNALVFDNHHEVEFRAFRWGSLSDGPKLITPFKRAVYEQVVAGFSRFVQNT